MCLPDIDPKVSSLQLTVEERQAVLEDDRVAAIDIIKDELQRIFVMAAPLLVAHELELVPDAMLMVMMSNSNPEHSTEVIAAMGLSDLLAMFVFESILGGVDSALGTLSAQAFGGKRFRELWLTLQAGAIIFAASLPVLFGIFFNGGAILRFMGQDPKLTETASTIFILTAMSFPLLMIQALQRTALQAMNITTPLAISAVVPYFVSLPAAYALGHYTPWGPSGMYASNVINNFVRMLILVPVVMRNPVYRESWPGWKPHEAMQLVTKLMRLGFSGMLMVTFQTFSFTVVSFMAGYLPNPAIALTSNSIFNQILGFAMSPIFVFCGLGAVRTGNALGAGQTRRAALASQAIVGLCVTVGLIWFVVVTTGAESFTRTFTSDSVAVSETTKLLLHAGIITPVMGAALGVQAIFSACGEQWFGAKLNFVSVLIIAAPLSWLFASEFNGGITGLWLGAGVGFLGVAGSTGVWLRHMSWDKMALNARTNTHLSVDEAHSAEAA
ncbi:hypothetical protein Poli38472_002611 [Pythium oligandrum]|uniref:Multidrug and toxic compound extrusion protein n=1 Tax=Pythium oligandrum TaxID=41045 RepID=A0A8K1CI56_PYTOL|nr:hypothetical protein Poli38472_002611 [Pythium oligandrum]|eukprot:TMW63670.1 hypothetical protein Poli38472_002611 [Pythium oligandrum]